MLNISKFGRRELEAVKIGSVELFNTYANLCRGESTFLIQCRFDHMTNISVFLELIDFRTVPLIKFKIQCQN